MKPLLIDPAHCPHDSRQALPLEHIIAIVCLGCGTVAMTAPPDPPAALTKEQAAAYGRTGRLPGDQARPPPTAAPPPAPAAVVTVAPDSPAAEMRTIRALVDIPPFVDADNKTHNLKAGDLAAVPKGVAELLVRRQKAALVEVAAA